MTLREEFRAALGIVASIGSDPLLPPHGVELWSIIEDWLVVEDEVLARYSTLPDQTSERPSVRLVRLLNQEGEGSSDESSGQSRGCRHDVLR